MIKIKVNYTSCSSRITLLLLSLFGVTACAPIALPRLPIQLPQVYSAQQPPVSTAIQQQRPQPMVQNTRQNTRAIPKAGDLIAAPAKVARAPVSVTPQLPSRAQQPSSRVAPARETQRQAQQVTIPPVLTPVQQARSGNAAKPNYNYRPSASVRTPNVTTQNRQPIWEDTSRQVKPVQKKTVVVRRPSASVRRPVAPASKETIAVAKPTSPQADQTTQTNPAKTVQAQTRQAEVEVLDLSDNLSKNTSAQTQDKKTAEISQPRSYSSSPAVAILTKQANNQLTVGKAGRAAATLERALRIEPDNPALWLRLAEVNAQQGKKTQAASMARKALNMAPGDTGLQARAKRLMN